MDEKIQDIERMLNELKAQNQNLKRESSSFKTGTSNNKKLSQQYTEKSVQDLTTSEHMAKCGIITSTEHKKKARASSSIPQSIPSGLPENFENWPKKVQSQYFTQLAILKHEDKKESSSLKKDIGKKVPNFRIRDPKTKELFPDFTEKCKFGDILVEKFIPSNMSFISKYNLSSEQQCLLDNIKLFYFKKKAMESSVSKP